MLVSEAVVVLRFYGILPVAIARQVVSDRFEVQLWPMQLRAASATAALHPARLCVSIALCFPCRYVQQNCLRSLDGLEQLPSLNSLNVSSNGLTSLEQLQSCPILETLTAQRNHLSTAAGLQPLLQCTSLHTLDLQHNNIEDMAVIDIIVAMPQLRCLYLAGNPVVSKVPSYRKAMIARCSQLTYLDDRPVTDEERLWCQAW